MALNGELRNRSRFNLGKLLFWPVHRTFGGKLRLLVSGGSALPEDVHKAFHALGFNLTEGYGLTEAAPVLAVTRRSNRRAAARWAAAAGRRDQDRRARTPTGIGEVLAKGPNVMAGYFDDREATDAVLKEGWLHTGDLGRLDAEGQLFLVGRKKDVIIDANGKNVYPDELEELYGERPHIKELSSSGCPTQAAARRSPASCVPDTRPREESRGEIEEHFARVSADMPFYRRVKVLRTSGTASCRDLDPQGEAQAGGRGAQAAGAAAASGEKAQRRGRRGSDGWLYDLSPRSAQKPRGSVTAADAAGGATSASTR